MKKLTITLLYILSFTLVNAQVTVFSENFDNPPGNVTSSGSPGWFINTRLQVSGTNSDSSYIDSPGSVSYLQTNPFNVSSYFYVTLSFRSICKVEFFDGGTIEYSVDGGNNWDQLRDNMGAPNNNCFYLGSGNFRTQGSKFQEASYGIWDPGQPSIPDNTWWQTETFDISAAVGGNPDVRLRFKLADGNNNGSDRDGWFIDNILVRAALCEFNPPTVYQIAPFYNQTVYNLGPFTINAVAFDYSNIDYVNLNYTINGVAQAPILMANSVDSFFVGMLPMVNSGDTVCYYLEAVDASLCGNVAYYPGPGPSQTICFEAQEGITFPYCDFFDTALNLWTPSTIMAGTQWELGPPAFGATNSAYSAPNAWDINLNTTYTNNAVAYLMSPEFSFNIGAGATLEFWQNRNAEQGWDGVRLEWTTDTLGVWNVLGTLQGPACVDCVNWYNDDQLNSSNLPAWTGNSGGWIISSIVLDATFNNLPQCWFRFVFTSDGSVTTDGFSIDNFCLSLAEPNDVGVKLLVQPGTSAPEGYCLDVIAQVRNYGLNTQTSFPVSYSINGGPPVTGAYNGTLTPGALANVTLPCFTVPSGTFTICAWTELTGDANHYNDTTCATVTGIHTNTLTSCDDFESPSAGYSTTTNNATAAQWQLGTPGYGVTTGAHSGVNAWDINLNSGYGGGGIAHLYTPIYDMAGAVNPYISFFRNQASAQSEGLRISYNVNGSGVWTVLGSVGDPNGYNWYNNNIINAGGPGWDGASGGWVESRYYLQSLLNAVSVSFIQFRFEFESAFNLVPNDGVSIDDFCVKQPGPVDAGVSGIVLPGANSPAGSNSNVTVELRNFGTMALTTIPVAYSVNGGPPVTATYSGNLMPNNITTFSMPTFVVPSGQFDFCAWTEVSGDGDLTNDTTCKVSVGVPVIPLNYTSPYIENFDNANVGWTTSVTGAANSVWELGTPAYGTTNGAHSAPNAWDVNLATAYGNNAECTLTSPIFDMTNAVDAKLSFWRNHSVESGWDGTRLEYSVNGGPWLLLGAANLTAPCWVNWYNSTPNINSSGMPAWMGASGGWTKTEATCLSQFDSVGLVQFRFIFTSDASVTQDGFSIDDFQITIPIPLTAAPLNVNINAANNNFILPGQTIQFNSLLSNPGTTPLTSVNATLTIDGVPLVTDTVLYNPALQNGDNLLHTFSQLWSAVPGVHTICVITSDPNNGVDLNPFDDTTCTVISVFDSLTVDANNPYCTDFESGPQWVSLNALTYGYSTNSWQTGTPSQTILNGAHSGQNAWMTNLTANYPNRDTSALFTPVFVVNENKCYRLSFWHRFNTEQYADGGTVEYTVDNAQTWLHLGFASSQPQDWFNSPFVIALGGDPPGIPGWSGTEASWIYAQHDVTFYNSGPVIFRFRFGSDFTVNNYEGWSIDDFCFEEIPGPCIVGINEPESQGILLEQNIPNPFSNNTTIHFTLPEAGRVKIYITDLPGKLVQVVADSRMAPGLHSVTLDAQSLTQGIYYYTLESGNERITRKMVVIK